MTNSKKSLKSLSKDTADTSKVQGGRTLRVNEVVDERTVAEVDKIGDVDKKYVRRGDKYGNTEE